ncbi:MAG TPA: hypothetical protein VM100_08630 [Longimicrobiales bacterium]|nr:hypothetical protein [Longimicrobiales bacterium]
MLYIGAFLLGASSIALLVSFKKRSLRKPAVIGLIAGKLLMVVAVASPTSERRATSGATEMDRFIPRYQFHETHNIYVDAPVAQVRAAMAAVTAREIRYYQTLTRIRRCGNDDENILNPPLDEPLIDVATRTGFTKLSDTPSELVIGTYVVPQKAFAALNFKVVAQGKGSLVRTETRVFANNRRTARRFALYWRAIRPGSGIIRKSWLRAIKSRAESQV